MTGALIDHAQRVIGAGQRLLCRDGQKPQVELPSHVSNLAREALEVEKQG